MKVSHKINVGLSVLRKRPDGYHDLETLFVPCNAFCDELEIVESSSLEVDIDRCDWDPMQDLTAKAWRLLRDEFGIPPVRIGLCKGIPTGAGLGGGSADAAAALKIMNSLFALGLTDKELAGRASMLGSDCAFFIYDTPMFGEGRGEVLTPFDIDLKDWEIRVELPAGVSVSTKEAYAGIVPREADPSMNGRLPLREALSRPVEDWRGIVGNDFEKSVFAAHPEIAALKEKFYRDGAVYAAMSGSGSSVFGLFRK